MTAILKEFGMGNNFHLFFSPYRFLIKPGFAMAKCCSMKTFSLRFCLVFENSVDASNVQNVCKTLAFPN